MPSLKKRLDAVEDDFLKFELVENKFSQRADIHAFILLDRLLPGKDADIVCAAEHDIIYLDVDTKKLNKVITDEQVVELARCGVSFDDDGDGLALFV